MLYHKELTAHLREHRRHISVAFKTTLKELSKCAITATNTLCRAYKIDKVIAIKGTIDIASQWLYICICGIGYKVIRRKIHTLHHTPCTADNSLTISPGDCRGKEASNLPISVVGKAMRNAYRVCLDKLLTVILVVQCFEQIEHLFVAIFRVLCHRSSPLYDLQNQQGSYRA